MNDPYEIEQLRRNVSVCNHPGIPSHVRLADIPQPWRDRFREVLVGCQMPVVEGEGEVAYAADWALFLRRVERRLRVGHIATVLKDVQVEPSSDVLDAAPVLDPWCVVRDPVGGLSLHGAVSNHPLLPGKGRWIVTSLLIGLDLAAGHARTISRWYRLGRLVKAADIEALRSKPLNPAFTPVDIDEAAPWFETLRACASREGFDV